MMSSKPHGTLATCLHYISYLWSLPILRRFAIFAFIFNILHLARGLLNRKPVKVYHTSEPLSRKKTAGGKIIGEVLNDEKFKQSINQPVQPTPWLWEGRLQTLFTVVAPRWLMATPYVEYEREILKTTAVDPKLYDGEIAIDWLIKGASYDEGVKNRYSYAWGSKLPKVSPYVYEADSPILILCHGLAGGSTEHYIKASAYAGALRGYRCVVINQRGCGRHSLTTPQTFTAGYTEDLRQAICLIHDRYPAARLSLVGFSLGANLVTKYCGEEGDQCVVDCVVAVANPWDLSNSSNTLENSFLGHYLFSRGLAYNLKRLFGRYRPLFEADPNCPIDWKGVNNAKTIRDFDRSFVTKVFGYESANHYYRANSSSPYLTRIRCPFLSVNAKDDPVCTSQSTPLEEAQWNDCAVMVLTHFGGHSLDSFIGWKPTSWTIPFLLDFVDAVHRHTPVKQSLKLNSVANRSINV